MATTTLATLPPELLYPILTTHILHPTTTAHASLSLRLLSRSINTEILHQLFTLGHLDAKLARPKLDDYAASRICRVCRGTIRAERRDSAMNRVTVSQYLVGWLGRTCVRRDYRWWIWQRMRRAVAMVEEWEIGGDERRDEVVRCLVDRIITLFGVRDTWAYLGPHHDICKPKGSQFPDQFKDHRPAEFWCLLIGAYEGDLETVRYLLEDRAMARTIRKIERKVREPNDLYSAEGPEQKLGVECVAAALTVAVRRGHREMVEFLLDRGNVRSVCCEMRFWNGRTMLGTMFAATADQDGEVARLAVDTVRRVMGEWWANGLWVKQRRWCVEHLRYALDIPTASGILLDVLWTLLPGPCDPLWDSEVTNRFFFHLLCQAALTNDVERARLAVNATLLDRGEVVKRIHSWSVNDAYMPTPCKVKDELGVRSDRLLDGLNPIKIAAALSHFEMLKWLLGPGWDVQARVKPWQLKAHTWNQIKVLEKQAYQAPKNSMLWDFRQEAVYDVFVGQDRLPAYARFQADPRCLELILRLSKELSWGLETVMSAGTRSVDIFGTFVKYADLSKEVPQKVHRLKGGLFVEGARARTVGERSLQSALKAGRFDNARILLLEGVRLAEAIRSDGFFHDDPHAMAILKGLQDMNLPGLNVVSRTMQVLYWVNGDLPLRLKETKAVEGDDKRYIWKDGQKVKRKGAPSFRALRIRDRELRDPQNGEYEVGEF